MTLDEALGTRRLLAVRGNNFSGRTQLLREFCDANLHERGRIYIGPEVYNALSGLAMSVRQEIELHAGAPLETTENMAALHQLHLTDRLDRNPGLLSGGEQAALAVICGLALGPANLAIDCALEQLDAPRLAAAIALLNEGDNPLHGTVITDNRMDEWETHVASVEIAEVRAVPPNAAPVGPLEPFAITNIGGVRAEAIELRGIQAGYRNWPDVLENFSVKLERGQVHVLLGANGAGKSTCAKVLCGVLRPRAGEILFGSAPAQPWKTPGKTVSYHLQNPDVGLFESTVAAELGQAPGAAAALAAFGLGPVAGANPLSLPFPVRKRVSLAATIAGAQPWLFLDEPTLGADAASIAALAEIARRLADAGRGVIVVSHSLTFRRLLGGTEWIIEGGIAKCQRG